MGDRKRKKKDSVESYSQLVVPEKMKSCYWEYFGFPADNDANVISKERVICTICTTQVSYCANTSNLRSHLKTRHREIYEELEIRVKVVPPEIYRVKEEKNFFDSGSQIKLIKVEHIDPSKKFFEDEDLYDPVQYEEVDEQTITELDDSDNKIIKETILEIPSKVEDVLDNSTTLQVLMKMIISDLIPTETVQGTGFIAFFRHLAKSPNEHLPDAKTLNELIINYYNQLIGKFLTLVKQTVRNNNFSLCFEKWTGCEKNSFITISVNVLLENYELQNIVLDVVGKVDWKIWFQKHEYLKMHENCIAAVTNYDDTKLKEYFAENTRGK